MSSRFVLATTLLCTPVIARAQVAFTEICWMGSDVSTADEWVEITAAPNAAEPISLSGWTLTVRKTTGDEAAIFSFPADAMIAPGQSFVVANYGMDASRLAITPAFTTTAMTLPNTKLLLYLRDASGRIIDQADDGVGMPLAGANPSAGVKATMERIDLGASGAVAGNWRTATTPIGWDEGSSMLGSPGHFDALIVFLSSSSSSLSFAPSASSAPSVFSESSAPSVPIAHIVSISSPPTPCPPQSPLGIEISEVLPRPIDGEEWIELQNTTDRAFPLCGFALDDGESGGRLSRLDAFTIAPYGHLFLPRSSSKLALNDGGESLRLLAPDSSGEPTLLLSSLAYARAPLGQSFARLGDRFEWTARPTPGAANDVRDPAPLRPAAVIDGVLPNPAGRDDAGEWVAVRNVSDDILALDRWSLRFGWTQTSVPLTDVVLQPGSSARIAFPADDVALRNASGSVILADSNDHIASAVSWEIAAEGAVYGEEDDLRERTRARVIRVIDGDTLVAQFSLSPSAAVKKATIRLIGVDAPETVDPYIPPQPYGIEAANTLRALLDAKEIELEFDTELTDIYGRMLAYVFVDEMDVQRIILSKGLARTMTEFSYVRQAEYAAIAADARAQNLGLWSLSHSLSEETIPLGEAAEAGEELSVDETHSARSIPLPSPSLLLTEIYPSPSLGEEEWIELYNPHDFPVSLDGWHIGGPEGEQSKHAPVIAGVTIPPRSFGVLTHAHVRLSLNNDGDTVLLLAPDGSVDDTIAYPRLKKGLSYARLLRPARVMVQKLDVTHRWCPTTTPTPASLNLCTRKK